MPRARKSFYPPAMRFTLVTFLLLSALAVYGGVWYRDQLMAQARAQVFQRGMDYSTGLSNALNRRFALLSGLTAFIEADPAQHATTQEFTAFSSILHHTVKGVNYFALAPAGIVSQVYPADQTGKILGADLLYIESSHGESDIREALHSHQITLEHSHALLSDQPGLLVHQEIFSQGQFWGLSVMALDILPALEEAGIRQEIPGLQLALQDSHGSLIFGDNRIFTHQPEIIKVELPDMTLELAAIPEGDWNSVIRNRFLIFVLLEIMVIFSITMASYFITSRHENLELLVRERTDELSRELAERKRVEQELDTYRQDLEEMVTQRTLALENANTQLVKEIESRHQVENIQQFQKSLLKAQNDTSIDGILVVSPERKILSYNRSFVEMWDIPPEIIQTMSDEILIQSVLDKLVDPDGFLSRVNLLYKGHSYKGSEEIKLKDGRVFERYTSPITSSEGALYGRIWYFHDITEHKRAEEIQYKFSEIQHDRYRSLADNLRDIMLYVRYPDGQILEANKAACQAYGYSREEITSLSIVNLRAPHERDQIHAQLEQAFQYGMLFETVHIRKNGEQFPVEISSQGVKLGSEKVLLSVIRDISERKLAEWTHYQQIEENRRRAEELEALAEVSSAMRQAQDRSELIATLVRRSVEVMDAQAVALALINGMSLVFYGVSQAIQAWEGTTIAHNSLFWDVIREGRPLYIESNLTLARLGIAFENASPAPDLAACMIIPLKGGDATIGLLFVGFSSTQTYTPVQKRIAMAISEMAGNALRRMSVADALEQIVTERSRELDTIYRVTAAASLPRQLSVALYAALEAILAATHAQRGAIILCNEAGEQFQIAAEIGFPAELASRLNTSGLTDSLEGWVVDRKQPFISLDVSSDPRFKYRVDTGEVYAFLALPMKVAERVVGILEVARQGGIQPTVEEITLLSFIADHLALVVENASLLRQAEQTAIVEERNRLGRELHDSITQLLYSANLFAEGGRRLSELGNQAAVQEALTNVSQVVRQALKEMRLMIYELRSSGSTDQGLLQAIQSRLDAVEARAGVRAELQSKKLPPIPKEFEEAVYRIVVEALNNSLKHAAASTLVIAIRKEKSRLVVSVKDNGQGFYPAAALKSGGLGLTTMRERAEQIGGQLEIRSHPGEGAEVIIKIPINGKKHSIIAGEEQ